MSATADQGSGGKIDDMFAAIYKQLMAMDELSSVVERIDLAQTQIATNTGRVPRRQAIHHTAYHSILAIVGMEMLMMTRATRSCPRCTSLSF
jgi:hypothetical protein